MRPAGNRHRAISRALLVALCVSALLCVAVYSFLHAKQDTHASLIYIALLYAVTLPLALLYWRANRSDSIACFRLPRLHMPIAAAFLILAVAFGWVTEYWPRLSDETAYRFQARIFASGRLKADAMPGAPKNPIYTPEEIDFAQTIQTPTGWFAKYPPLWPLMLSVGYLLHIPWLVNPFLAALQLFLIWKLAKTWGSNTQVLAIVMIASSTYALAMDGGFESHASDAVTCLLAIGAALKGVRERSLGWIAISFLSVALSTEIRPYTGAALGLLCTAIVIREFWRSWRLLGTALAIIAGCAIASAAAFLMVNKLFTGDALLSPYALANGGRKIKELTMYPPEIFDNILHTWRWAITDTIHFTFPLMFFFVIYACWKEHTRRNELIYLALLFPVLIVAYTLQTMGSGSLYGERFYFEGFCPIAIVASRGFNLMVENWRVRERSVYAVLAVLLALQAATLGFAVRDAAARWRPYEEAYDLAHASGSATLVFLKDHTPPFTSKHVNWNAIDWRHAQRVYLNDPGPTRRDVVACRFDRPEYVLIQYDSRTGHMFATHGFAVCTAVSLEVRPTRQSGATIMLLHAPASEIVDKAF